MERDPADTARAKTGGRVAGPELSFQPHADRQLVKESRQRTAAASAAGRRGHRRSLPPPRLDRGRRLWPLIVSAFIGKLPAPKRNQASRCAIRIRAEQAPEHQRRFVVLPVDQRLPCPAGIAGRVEPSAAGQHSPAARGEAQQEHASHAARLADPIPALPSLRVLPCDHDRLAQQDVDVAQEARNSPYSLAAIRSRSRRAASAP